MRADSVSISYSFILLFSTQENGNYNMVTAVTILNSGVMVKCVSDRCYIENVIHHYILIETEKTNNILGQPAAIYKRII